MSRLRTLGALAVFAALAGSASADGLYLKLAAQDSRVQPDQPVKVRLTATVTRPFTLPGAPLFLIDDGSGLKARPEIVVRAVDSPEGGVSVGPGTPFEASWEVALPHPGKYRIQARYRLSDRVISSNKVSVDVVEGGRPVAGQ